MEKIKVDYLHHHKDYKVVQHEDMYHFNTDTCLLGEFIQINENSKVLDVGTNNGALLVYILKKGGQGYGIEINQEALKIAELTLKENQLEATLIHGDFKNYQSPFLFDVIVSNPPYFSLNNHQQTLKNENIKIARHEEHLTLNELASSIVKNLKKDGLVFLVYRYAFFEKLENTLNQVGLFIQYYQVVYDHRKKEPKSLLICASFKKVKKMKLEDQII